MKKQLKAFTLIELLVVISIISLLIAILIPALASARRTAQSVQCKSNMRQVLIAFSIYHGDFNETFPPTSYSKVGTTGFGTLTWADLLKNNLGSHTPDITTTNLTNGSTDVPKVFQCPTLDASVQTYTRWIGTGYNNHGLSPKGDNTTGSVLGGFWAGWWVSLSKVTSPSEILVTADSEKLFGTTIRGFLQLDPAYGGYLAFRHLESLNASYADGHVKARKNTELKGGWSNFNPKYPWMQPQWTP